MRIASILILSSLSLFACKGEPSLTTGVSDGESSGSGGESSTTDNPTTGASGGGTCVPGESKACACTDGGMGAQVCAADGKSFGDCTCEGGGTVSDSQATTAPDTTTTEPGTTTTEPGTTTSDTTGPVGSTGVGSTGPDTTTGGVCEDTGEEPNEDEQDAVDLGDLGCMDDPQTFMGVVVGDTDVDWFTYHGVFGFECGMVDPTPTQTLTASDSVRMCVFADCDMGQAMFQCQDGAMQEMSPDGLPGCCNTGDVAFLLNCSMSGIESAQMYVRLDQAAPDACVDYSVEYSYQPAN